MTNGAVPKFIIAIDAGGSKTDGLIKNIDKSNIDKSNVDKSNIENRKQWQLTVGSASLSHDLDRACERIELLANSLMHQANAVASECALVCGAAGASCQTNAQFLDDCLGSDYASKLITTDARTSLFGASQGKPALVVAIGTGSVAMRLDKDGAETLFGGWGFPAGDLGSGAQVGRELVSRVLVAFEKRKLDPLANKLLEKIGNNRQMILDWLKRATATDFAALAPLVFEFQRQSEMARSIVQQAVLAVEELIDYCQTKPQLPVTIIGGMANAIESNLSQRTKNILTPAAGGPLQGAIFLAERELMLLDKQEFIKNG